jgi:predicted metal-dependent phosphoesterase TrpH
VLADVDPAHCPTRLNFHCHTLWSDGSLPPETLAEQALALGLEHLAITDHHACRGYKTAAARFAAALHHGQTAPTLWRGVEISCLLEGCLVHVLALGFREAVTPAVSNQLQQSFWGGAQAGVAPRGALHEVKKISGL